MKILVRHNIKRIWFVLLLGMMSISMLKAQFNVTESFMRSNITSSDIITGGAPNPAVLTSGNADPVNNGWLRLTTDATNQRGYAYINKSFPTNLGVYMEFEYKAWRSKKDDTYHGADGFSVFFFDADSTFRIGADGGSLGYAQKRDWEYIPWSVPIRYRWVEKAPGLRGGYLGIGIDEYGNFATLRDGRSDGYDNATHTNNSSSSSTATQTEVPNSITLRGPSKSNNGLPYRYLTHKQLQTSASNNGVNSVDYNTVTSTRPNDNTFYRKVKVYIEPIGTPQQPKYKIRVLWRTSPTDSDVEHIVYETTDPIPANMKVGFAASTGAGINYHEVRNFYATTTGGVRVQKDVDKPNANPNENITYTVTVTNETEATVSNLGLTDILLDGDNNPLTNSDFEITSIKFDNKGKSASTASGYPHGVAVTPSFTNDITFSTTMNLAAQSEATFTIVGKAKTSMTGKIVKNKVDLDITNIGITDPDLTNNTATVSSTILNPNLDLKIEKNVDNDGVAKSTGNTFTIEVTNMSNAPKPGGTGSQHEVKITDVIPAGLTVTGYSAPGWTRTGTGNNFTFTRSDVLGSQLSYPAITIQVTPTQSGSPWTNTAKLEYRAGNNTVTKESSATLKWLNLWVGSTGTNGTNWGTASNWTVGIPASGDDVEFATAANNEGTAAKNDLYLDNNRVIGSLTNATTRNLVIPTGKQLKINGTVTDTNVTGGTIIVEAAADAPTGTLVFDNPNNNTNVDATVQFYNKAYTCEDCGDTDRQQWQYFGIPVSEEGGVFPLNVIVNKWSEGAYGNKWVAVEPSESMTAFTGYEINDAVNITPTEIYNFNGKLNVGDKTINLTKSNNVNYSGWNLIANSYTGAIPITTDAIQYNNGQNFGVYLFNTGSRHSWRKLSGNTVSGVESGRYTVVPSQLGGEGQLPDRIPSMHAFMVKVENAGPLTLKYDQLLQNTTDIQPAWRSASKTTKLPYIVMDVIGTESADRVWIFEKMTNTRGFDAGWDGEKMTESGLMQLYVSGNDDLKLQVATVPQLHDTYLGLKPDNNENISVSFLVSGDVEPRGLHLRDMLTGRTYPIRNNAEYTLPGAMGENNNRFKVVTIAQGDEGKYLMADDSAVEIFVSDKRIGISNKSNENSVATVYDITGKVVAKQNIESNNTTYINGVGVLPNGIYVVKVKSNTFDVSNRVMIK